MYACYMIILFYVYMWVNLNVDVGAQACEKIKLILGMLFNHAVLHLLRKSLTLNTDFITFS